MSDVPEVSLVERLRRANARLREVVAAKDAEIAALRSAKDTENAELRRMVAGQGLRIAELERRLGMGSDDSGTPSSKESIQAKAARKAQRRARDKDVSSRERSPDRERGGQPGHEGHGLARELDPDRVEPVAPPTRCRGCGAGLGGAVDAGAGWSQTWDVDSWLPTATPAWTAPGTTGAARASSQAPVNGHPCWPPPPRSRPRCCASSSGRWSSAT